MPDYAHLREQSLAAVPQFVAEAREAFAVLESKYGYRYHAQRLESEDDIRDANARVIYLSPTVEVEISWYFSVAGIAVSFAATPEPWAIPPRPAFFGELREGATPAARLDTLAEMGGHADDPAFLLGDLDRVDGRSINRRVKIVQMNLRGVLEGLAAATERYAADILRGDTTPLPEAMRFYTRKLRG